MLKPFPLLLSLLLLPVVPVKALSPFSAPAIVAEDSPNAQIERSIRQVTVKITSEINRGSGIIIGKKGSIYFDQRSRYPRRENPTDPNPRRPNPHSLDRAEFPFKR